MIQFGAILNGPLYKFVNKNNQLFQFSLDFIRLGQDLLDDHRFAADCVQPKCAELRRMVQKLEMTLNEKKRLLHKFLDLNEGIGNFLKFF